jgi:hypothetical protein
VNCAQCKQRHGGLTGKGMGQRRKRKKAADAWQPSLRLGAILPEVVLSCSPDTQGGGSRMEAMEPVPCG